MTLLKILCVMEKCEEKVAREGLHWTEFHASVCSLFYWSKGRYFLLKKSNRKTKPGMSGADRSKEN